MAPDFQAALAEARQTPGAAAIFTRLYSAEVDAEARALANRRHHLRDQGPMPLRSTPTQLRDRAVTEAREAIDFKDSPAGRFLVAITSAKASLERAALKLDEMSAAYSRGFPDNAETCVHLAQDAEPLAMDAAMQIAAAFNLAESIRVDAYEASRRTA